MSSARASTWSAAVASPDMKIVRNHAVVAMFFACVCSVSTAQNGTAQTGQSQKPKEPGSARAPVVQNFPSQQQAQANWDKAQPRTESATEKGPNFDASPNGHSKGGGRVSGAELPNPKIDYQGEAIERLSPMGPEEIRKFEALMLERARAMSEVPGGPFSIKGHRIMRVSFEPNAKPETVDVALNMGAVISFVDRAGNPIIVDGVKAFSYAFEVSVMETDELKAKGGSSSLEITPKALAGRGTMMVRLSGVQTPLIIQVRVGDSARQVDSLVQAVVPILAPSRSVLPGDRLEADSGQKVAEMQGFLMGIPPEGAVDVQVRQVSSTTVWLWKNRLYVRTPHTIFSPGWFQRQSAVDGTAVYEMPLTSVVRMGVDGRELEAVFDLPYIPAAAGGKQK